MGDGVIKQLGARLLGLTDQTDSVPPTETKGGPGFANYNGYVEEKERNANLTGFRKYITYSDILANTSIVGAGVRYFLNLVSKAQWNVEPFDDSPEAAEYATLVESVINDMDTPWYRVVRRSAMYRFYGFSIQEWTAKRREDGKLGLLDIEPRPQHTIERWDTDEQGRVRGVVQRLTQTQLEVYLPIEKIVYVTDDSITDNPEGIGLFRHIVEATTRLKRYEQLEGFGFETDLRGIPIVKAPLSDLAELVKRGEITDQQRAAILSPLRKFVSNHVKSAKLGMMIDSSAYRSEDTAAQPSSKDKWSVELLRSSNTSQEQIATAINRVNHEVARLLGVEALLLGADGRGSEALSRDKSQNFFLIVDSTLMELAESYGKSIVTRIGELNGLDITKKPTFKPEAIKFKDVEEITTALKDLASAGAPVMPDDPVINEIRDLLGLSRVDLAAALNDLALGRREVEDSLNRGASTGDGGADTEDEE